MEDRRKFNRRRSASRYYGVSVMGAITSAGEAYWSTSLSFAVPIDGRAIGAALGAGEEPGQPAESQSTQCPVGRIVGQADAPVSEEAGESFPALKYVVDRLETAAWRDSLARSPPIYSSSLDRARWSSLAVRSVSCPSARPELLHLQLQSSNQRFSLGTDRRPGGKWLGLVKRLDLAVQLER